jgi:hypothetical protein
MWIPASLEPNLTLCKKCERRSAKESVQWQNLLPDDLFPDDTEELDYGED